MSAAVLRYVRFIALAVVVFLAACSGQGGPVSTAGPPSISPAVPTSVPAASLAATMAPPTAIGDYLPTELDGVELHTFAVAEDVTARLADATGTELELAYASEHGARFVQAIAIRAPRTDPDALGSLFAAAAFPPDGSTAEVTRTQLGGEAVVTVADPAAIARLGTYYLLARDDVLIVVEAFRPQDAADMIGALPRP